MPWTAAGAGEATAAAEGRTAGTLAPAAGELVAAALGPAATAALEVEVPVGGVGPWRTHGRKE